MALRGRRSGETSAELVALHIRGQWSDADDGSWNVHTNSIIDRVPRPCWHLDITALISWLAGGQRTCGPVGAGCIWILDLRKAFWKQSSILLVALRRLFNVVGISKSICRKYSGLGTGNKKVFSYRSESTSKLAMSWKGCKWEKNGVWFMRDLIQHHSKMAFASAIHILCE